MTKREAYKLIEDQFGNIQCGEFMGGLCFGLYNEELRKDFYKYWNEINKTNVLFISDEFFDRELSFFDNNTQITMLRLIILNHFIEDTYK